MVKHPEIYVHIYRFFATYVVKKKNPHMSRPEQFKPRLFKSQLYNVGMCSVCKNTEKDLEDYTQLTVVSSRLGDGFGMSGQRFCNVFLLSKRRYSHIMHFLKYLLKTIDQKKIDKDHVSQTHSTNGNYYR